MLVLQRSEQQSIIIGENIEVKVLRIKDGHIKLGINAPKHIEIKRDNIKKGKKKENV